MLEGFHVIKDGGGDGRHLTEPPFVMLAGKAGQTHEFACDRDRSRAGDEGRAPLGDGGVLRRTKINLWSSGRFWRWARGPVVSEK